MNEYMMGSPFPTAAKGTAILILIASFFGSFNSIASESIIGLIFSTSLFILSIQIFVAKES